MINKYEYESAPIDHDVAKSVSNHNACGNPKSSSSVNYIKNPYINEDEDVLFHLLFSNKSDDLKAMFGEVKFVCMGGTAHRMRDFAQFIQKELDLDISNGRDLENLTGLGHRYSMFKVGPVLCVNHGMGFPSITILLHELIKLMQYAQVQNPIFFRIGTSGGIDVQAGTVVIANACLNDYLQPYFEVPVLGKRESRVAILDENIANDLEAFCKGKMNFPVLLGTTVSSEHFYESTAMKSSAICEHSDKDRKEYYNKLKAAQVLNMDMETLALAAMTHKVGIRAAVLNVVTNDCFLEKEDSFSPEEFKEWQRRPQKVVAQYIKDCLKK